MARVLNNYLKCQAKSRLKNEVRGRDLNILQRTSLKHGDHTIDQYYKTILLLLNCHKIMARF